jgi:hypothetical protein
MVLSGIYTMKDTESKHSTLSSMSKKPTNVNSLLQANLVNIIDLVNKPIPLMKNKKLLPTSGAGGYKSMGEMRQNVA